MKIYNVNEISLHEGTNQVELSNAKDFMDFCKMADAQLKKENSELIIFNKCNVYYIFDENTIYFCGIKKER